MSSAPVPETDAGACIACRVVVLSAEMDVLGGREGEVGVNGSSEADGDGDGDELDERSPARAAKGGRAARRKRFGETPRGPERSSRQIRSVGTSILQFVTNLGGGQALPWTATARAVEVGERGMG
jgi:hypothetical protein